jgi:hypothetical protein
LAQFHEAYSIFWSGCAISLSLYIFVTLCALVNLDISDISGSVFRIFRKARINLSSRHAVFPNPYVWRI